MNRAGRATDTRAELYANRAQWYNGTLPQQISEIAVAQPIERIRPLAQRPE
jgi:hypothetical protein